jgi:hypothetical protein
MISPVPVFNAVGDMPHMIIPPDTHIYGGVDMPSGSLPAYAMDEEGSVVLPNRVLLWVRATCTSGSDIVLSLVASGTPRPGASDTYGRNAVWSDYDRVWHYGSTEYIGGYETIASPIPDSTGNSIGGGYVFRSLTNELEGQWIEVRDGALPGVYTGTNTSNGADNGDLPLTWRSVYNGLGATNNLQSYIVELTPITPVAPLVLLIAGSIPDRCQQDDPGLRFAWNDVSESDQRALVYLQRGTGDTITAGGGVVSPSGGSIDSITEISGQTNLHAVAVVIENNLVSTFADGQPGSPVAVGTAPTFANFNNPSIQRDRRSNGDQYFGGIVAECRFAIGANAADWKNGRLELETVMVQRAGDATFVVEQ